MKIVTTIIVLLILLIMYIRLSISLDAINLEVARTIEARSLLIIYLTGWIIPIKALYTWTIYGKVDMKRVIKFRVLLNAINYYFYVGALNDKERGIMPDGYYELMADIYKFKGLSFKEIVSNLKQSLVLMSAQTPKYAPPCETIEELYKRECRRSWSFHIFFVGYISIFGVTLVFIYLYL